MLVDQLSNHHHRKRGLTMNDNSARNTGIEMTEKDHRRYHIEHNLIGTSMSYANGDRELAALFLEHARVELKAGNVGDYSPPELAGEWAAF
jgi:hypothetical protein